MNNCASILHIMRKKFNSFEDAQVLGQKIRRARLSKSLTLVALGRAVNVDHSQISRYERGQMIHASKNLQKICSFLQIYDGPDRSAATSATLGKKIDELLRLAPEYEPAVMKLVDALEGLLTAAHLTINSARPAGDR
jgi:transcriptional regulator with XRE-family HTH domain